MTTPKVETKFMHGDRWYVHSATGDKVPGVSAIKGMLPSYGLTKWYKNFTADYCLNNLDELLRLLAKNDRDGAHALVAGSTDRYSRRAADRGTRVHERSENLLRDVLAGKKSTFRVSKEEMPYLRNMARFVSEFEVEPVMLETTVWSQEHDYAGTFDFMGHIKGYEGLSIVDYKSGQSGIYPDAGVQQTGYVWADSYIDDDGNFQPMPEVKQAFGLWLRPDGWALHPLRTDEVMWDVFLHLREVYRYTVEVAPTVVGKPINANPLKKTWKGKR